jgi:hypothetical protein
MVPVAIKYDLKPLGATWRELSKTTETWSPEVRRAFSKDLSAKARAVICAIE